MHEKSKEQYIFPRLWTSVISRFMDRVYEVHVFERVSSQRLSVVRWGPHKDFCALKVEACEKAAQREEKEQWTSEKAKSDNALKLRGISFVVPDEKDSKKPSKTLGRIWDCLRKKPCFVS